MQLNLPGQNDREISHRARISWAPCLLTTAFACLTLATVVQTTYPAQAQSLQGGDVVAASVNLSGSSRRIPSSFTGFSIEFTQVLAYTGRTPENVNTDFSQLLNNIGQLDNGLPLIRIGGNTAEKVWYNPDGQPMPPGITFDITPTYLEALGASFSHSGAKLLMGLNLAMDDPDYAVELAREAWARIPHDRILAFQISNEANIFPYKTYYTDPSTGQAVPIRPSDWTFDEYISEFNAHKNALYNRVSTSLPLSGPVFSGGQKDDGRWKNYFPDFMRAQASDINSVSYHGYPYTACPDDPDDIPTISDVLSNKASYDFVQGFVPIVAEAGKYGQKMRISETNSMTCGGVNGVSNTLAAALWATDMMFEAANIGAGGVNIISGSQPEMTPMYFDGHIDYEGTATYTPQVYPLYYGMLLFAQAAANQGSLVPVTSEKTGNMKVWATRDNQGTVRVVALNKDQSLSGNARITIAGTSGSASLTRLSASSVSAKTGLTLAGQTFDGTTDGKPKGSYTSTSVSSSNGTYVFSLPKGSAAMLTVGGSGGGGGDDDAVEVRVDLDKSTYTKGQKMYVEATSSDSPSQVKFYIDNQQVWSENISPYWLGGDSNTGSSSQPEGYSTSGLAVGSHTLKAVAQVNGVEYTSATLEFEVDN